MSASNLIDAIATAPLVNDTMAERDRSDSINSEEDLSNFGIGDLVGHNLPPNDDSDSEGDGSGSEGDGSDSEGDGSDSEGDGSDSEGDGSGSEGEFDDDDELDAARIAAEIEQAEQGQDDGVAATPNLGPAVTHRDDKYVPGTPEKPPTMRSPDYKQYLQARKQLQNFWDERRQRAEAEGKDEAMDEEGDAPQEGPLQESKEEGTLQESKDEGPLQGDRSSAASAVTEMEIAAAAARAEWLEQKRERAMDRLISDPTSVSFEQLQLAAEKMGPHLNPEARRRIDATFGRMQRLRGRHGLQPSDMEPAVRQLLAAYVESSPPEVARLTGARELHLSPGAASIATLHRAAQMTRRAVSWNDLRKRTVRELCGAERSPEVMARLREIGEQMGHARDELAGMSFRELCALLGAGDAERESRRVLQSSGAGAVFGPGMGRLGGHLWRTIGEMVGPVPGGTVWLVREPMDASGKIHVFRMPLPDQVLNIPDPDPARWTEVQLPEGAAAAHRLESQGSPPFMLAQLTHTPSAPVRPVYFEGIIAQANASVTTGSSHLLRVQPMSHGAVTCTIFRDGAFLPEVLVLHDPTEGVDGRIELAPSLAAVSALRPPAQPTWRQIMETRGPDEMHSLAAALLCPGSERASPGELLRCPRLSVVNYVFGRYPLVSRVVVTLRGGRQLSVTLPEDTILDTKVAHSGDGSLLLHVLSVQDDTHARLVTYRVTEAAVEWVGRAGSSSTSPPPVLLTVLRQRIATTGAIVLAGTGEEHVHIGHEEGVLMRGGLYMLRMVGAGVLDDEDYIDSWAYSTSVGDMALVWKEHGMTRIRMWAAVPPVELEPQGADEIALTSLTDPRGTNQSRLRVPNYWTETHGVAVLPDRAGDRRGTYVTATVGRDTVLLNVAAREHVDAARQNPHVSSEQLRMLGVRSIPLAPSDRPGTESTYGVAVSFGASIMQHADIAAKTRAGLAGAGVLRQLASEIVEREGEGGGRGGGGAAAEGGGGNSAPRFLTLEAPQAQRRGLTTPPRPVKRRRDVEALGSDDPQQGAAEIGAAVLSRRAGGLREREQGDQGAAWASASGTGGTSAAPPSAADEAAMAATFTNDSRTRRRVGALSRVAAGLLRGNGGDMDDEESEGDDYQAETQQR